MVACHRVRLPVRRSQYFESGLLAVLLTPLLLEMLLLCVLCSGARGPCDGELVEEQRCRTAMARVDVQGVFLRNPFTGSPAGSPRPDSLGPRVSSGGVFVC